MVKLFLNTLFAVVLICLSPGSTLGNSISYNYAFSDSSPSVYVPRFDSSLGALSSVTYSVTNMSLGNTVILDLDDASGPLSVNKACVSHSIVVAPRIGPFVWPTLLSMTAWISGDFIGYDDGDGLGSHNGGDDEIRDSFGFLGFSGTESFNDSDRLTSLCGPLMYETFIGPMSYVAVPIQIGQPPRNIETYWEEISYSGNLAVTYDYRPVPVPTTILLVGSGLAVFGHLKRKLNRKSPVA